MCIRTCDILFGIYIRAPEFLEAPISMLGSLQALPTDASEGPRGAASCSSLLVSPDLAVSKNQRVLVWYIV